jgi:hypothetical protein
MCQVSEIYSKWSDLISSAKVEVGSYADGKIDSSYCIKDSMDMQTSPSQTSTKTRGNNVKDTINSFKSKWK